MTLGERLRELRKNKDWTLRDVAAMVNINFTYLSKIENGRLDFTDFPQRKADPQAGESSERRRGRVAAPCGKGS